MQAEQSAETETVPQEPDALSSPVQSNVRKVGRQPFCLFLCSDAGRLVERLDPEKVLEKMALSAGPKCTSITSES